MHPLVGVLLESLLIIPPRCLEFREGKISLKVRLKLDTCFFQVSTILQSQRDYCSEKDSRCLVSDARIIRLDIDPTAAERKSSRWDFVE